MNKTFIAAFLAATAAFSSAAFADGAADKVEIAFKVGDSVLKINGTDVSVETPYIAGDGTTLVPLRVITEAFGAQVDWEGTAKTITLVYPDVNIVLQIGNKVAKVNDHSETLLEAPVLSENGVTMVPLRFISETFGATVSYDNTNGGILVTKESQSNLQTVVGITEKERVGDSYYNWSVKTPASLKMTDRGYDGMSTTFTADDSSEVYIDVIRHDEDTPSFDEEYAKVKDYFSKYTLTEAQKLTDENGNQYMHFGAKDSETIIDYREYYKDNLSYQVVSIIDNSDDTTIKDTILAFADTFKLSYDKANTHDLSNAHEGVRVVKNEDYKLIFEVPANFKQVKTSEAENEFIFTSPDITSSIHISIYSKTDEVTAKSLAHKDHDSRIKLYNPDKSTVTEVESKANGIYSYTHTISGTKKHDVYSIDSFFEKGDYVYNIAVTVPSEKDREKAEKLIRTVQTEEIDSSRIGKLLRNDPDSETTISHEIKKLKLAVPASWKKTGESLADGDAQSLVFVNSGTNSMLYVTVDDMESFSGGELFSMCSKLAESIKSDKKNEFLIEPTHTKINGESYMKFSYMKEVVDGSVGYSSVYMTVKAKKLVIYSFIEQEQHYHAEPNDEMINIMSSITEK